MIDAPSRFINFRNTRNFTTHVLGVSGIGPQAFLFQILLGAELLSRLSKEPLTTSYTSLMTDEISALLVLVDQWMQHVTVRYQKPAVGQTSPGQSPLMIYPRVHNSQADALIRFGEAIEWPYMEEARTHIENLREGWRNGTQTGLKAGADLCDWFFGLVPPGRMFSHRIMACLIYASPTFRAKSSSPFYDAGLVVKGKSYWPRRTAIARIFGGRPSCKTVGGWVGPLPAPVGIADGWVRCPLRTTTCPVPKNNSPSIPDSFGAHESSASLSDAELQSFFEPEQWMSPNPPGRDAVEQRASLFKKLELTKAPAVPPATGGAASQIDYRAKALFHINGTPTTFDLYSTPLFVLAPPCIGTHVMHQSEAAAVFRRSVKAYALKGATPDPHKLLLIDALGDGEESVARAWCAERHRNAIIRKGDQTCFACTCLLATTKHGLGFNVVIWVS